MKMYKQIIIYSFILYSDLIMECNLHIIYKIQRYSAESVVVSKRTKCMQYRRIVSICYKIQSLSSACGWKALFYFLSLKTKVF